MVAKPVVPHPQDHGWVLEETGLQPLLMTQSSAPKELIELTTCKCQSSKCQTQACKCLKANLKCSRACLCEGDSDVCENSMDTDDDVGRYSSDSDTELDEDN